MLQELASNAIADISNICTHFVHPLTNHHHSCSCLLCASRDQDPSQSQQEQRVRQQYLSLAPMATPSDLDLIKTGSSAIRQLVVLHAERSFDEKTMPVLRHFCRELKTHLNYQVHFTLPSVDAQVPFHVLVFVLCGSGEDLDVSVLTWFQNVFTRCTRRAVVLCAPSCATRFEQHDPKMTLLVYQDLLVTLKGLTHGMMVTKQRLMPKDLSRFLNATTMLHTHTQQPGMCLFL